MILAALLATATAAEVRHAPAPVRAFIARRESCNHWAGEEAYDRNRAKEIDRALSAGRCDRIEADAAILRRRYRDRRDVLRLIQLSADWF